MHYYRESQSAYKLNYNVFQNAADKVIKGVRKYNKKPPFVILRLVRLLGRAELHLRKFLI